MSLLIALLAHIGLPEPVRKPAAWLVLGLLALAGLAIIKGCYDRALIRDHEAEREAMASQARTQAADERVADAAANAARERELHDAIRNAPAGGELSPAARALACERLRKLGRIPHACRPAGSDGGQAGAE